MPVWVDKLPHRNYPFCPKLIQSFRQMKCWQVGIQINTHSLPVGVDTLPHSNYPFCLTRTVPSAIITSAPSCVKTLQLCLLQRAYLYNCMFKNVHSEYTRNKEQFKNNLLYISRSMIHTFKKQQQYAMRSPWSVAKITCSGPCNVRNQNQNLPPSNTTAAGNDKNETSTKRIKPWDDLYWAGSRHLKGPK